MMAGGVGVAREISIVSAVASALVPDADRDRPACARGTALSGSTQVKPSPMIIALSVRQLLGQALFCRKLRHPNFCLPKWKILCQFL